MHKRYPSFLLPFPLAALLAGGCGKKIEEPDRNPASGIQSAEASTTIPVSATYGTNGEYVIPQDGDMIIPGRISTLSGGTVDRIVRLYVNLTAFSFEFNCTYVTTAGSNQYLLQSCNDPSGNNLGLTLANVDNYGFALDHGKKIVLEVRGAERTLQTSVQGQLKITWK